jgi:hypothetical protein
MNGLKVNYKLGREVAAKVAVVDFAAPVSNPETSNKRLAEGAGADNIRCDELAGSGIALEY